MSIAITGATGQLGQLAIAALKERGVSPIALARSPEKLAASGVEARAFDYETADPKALEGVETLVLISSSEVGRRFPQHQNVIAAAKAAGVKRILYTSLLKGAASPMKLAAEHIETEAALQASGLAVTLLRNGWYAENLTGALGAAIEHGAIIGASGEGRYSAAARKDYAEAIAVVATGEGHEGKVYELAGDDSFTGADLAAEVAAQSGKPVAWAPLSEADYAKALEGFGLPAAFAAILADSDAKTAEGALEDNSKTLSRLIGRPTTPLRDVVAAALA